jgi:putative DNA modification/repair radical SAM protein
MEITEKLEILADAAKYDASCASSAAPRRTSLGAAGKAGGIGSTRPRGICHSFTPDGRCISLLKILLTNVCLFDCCYCVSRRSSDVRRARFGVDEIVRLTLGFYRRNYIEGLFLSSGIFRSPDHTMAEMTRVARTLRETHLFRGYIHLKAVPGASAAAVAEAGAWADRLSVNIELPTADGLARLAPDKDAPSLRAQMGDLRHRIETAAAEARAAKRAGGSARPPRFAPAGQSTQMIIGADGATDATILRASADLYRAYRLKRVYYSAFSPVGGRPGALPAAPPPLAREHRLYQADWLLRFYGFAVDEVTGTTAAGMLDLTIDPKLAWALANRGQFPVDVNAADRLLLLRVPGLGVRSVERLLAMRRLKRLRWDDLGRLRLPLAKLRPFLVTADACRAAPLLDAADLADRLRPPRPRQLDLFPAA